MIVLLTIPVTVVLSTWIGVGGCGCPNLCSVMRSIFASRALRNNAHNSASAADDATKQRIVHRE